MAQQRHHRAHVAAHRRAAFEHDKRAAAPDLATVVSVVYVTATPTFSGPIAGYVTLNPPSSTQNAAASGGLVGIPIQNSRSAASSSSAVVTSSAPAIAKGAPLQNSRSAEASSSSASLENASTRSAARSSQQPTTLLTSSAAAYITSISSAASSSQQPTTFLTSSTAAYITSTSSASAADATSTIVEDAVTASSSSTSPALALSTTTTKSQEQPTGMTTGAKAGLAIGILLGLGILAGLAFFFLRLKRKHNTRNAADDEKSGFRGPQQLVRSRTSVRKSRFSAPRLSLRPISHQMFPAGSNEKQDGERAQSFRVAPIQHTLGTNPFHDANVFIPPAVSVLDIPKPLSIKSRDRNGSVSESFVSSVPSITDSLSAAAASNNVHRVHADFAPSMDDELELRAGALVRMLHEYDDGWALCIRLDRSQQGVVPRSCLSKMPVKPRAAQNQPRVPQPAFMLQTGGGRMRAQSAAAASSVSLTSSRTAPVELEGSPTLDSSPTLGVGRKPLAGQGF